MKHRYIILIALCLLAGHSAAFAQLFSTSASTFHAYESGSASMSHSEGMTMRSTSSFATTSTLSSYSTAPIRIANGSIQTVANQLDNIRLADDLIDYGTSSKSGFIPTGPQRSIAPPTKAPLHLDWDALLFLLALVTLYVSYSRRRSLFSKFR